MGLAAILLSCSKDEAPSTPPDTGPSDDGADAAAQAADKACTDEASAFCERLEKCNPFGLLTQFGARPQCNDRMKIHCIAGRGATGSTFATDKIAGCAKALPTVSCYDFVTKNLPAGCADSGILDDGKGCGSNYQCRSGDCRVDKGMCGLCGPTSVAIDGTCTTDGPCGAQARCVSGKCTRLVKTGGDCDTSIGLSCWLGAVACVGNKCTENAMKAGDACDELSCDYLTGLLCNATTKVCDKIVLAKAGETCVIGDKPCEASAFCKTDGTRTGKCVARAVDGAGCDPSVGAVCVFPYRCDSTSSKCVPPDPSQCD